MPVGFRAVQDRIVVQRVEDNYQTPGGLYVPDLAKERPAQGVVVAVGPGKYIDGDLQKVNIQVGDYVLFGKFSGAEVKVGVEDFLILREEDIFLVLEKDTVDKIKNQTVAPINGPLSTGERQ